MANNKVDRLSQYLDNEPILWNDRKRYLGLPISFTRYSFDQNKFYIKTGFFNNVNNELLLYRVLDIQHKRSFFQKIFGVGSIVLVTADKTTPNLEVKNVRDSERVAKALSNIVEMRSVFSVRKCSVHPVHSMLTVWTDWITVSIIRSCDLTI